MDYEGFFELVKKRRTIRSFRTEPVPDEYIDKIIEVARWAPSAANSQPWEFIVIKKAELRQKIVQFIKADRPLTQEMELTREPALRYPGHSKPVVKFGYEDAPVFIIICGDERTAEAYPLHVTLQRAQSNIDSSLANAFLYMLLAATTLGLGAQWVSAVRNHFARCMTRDLLGIPAELQIYEMMAVGYPAAEPKTRPVRDRVEMVHQEHYDRSKFRTDADIKEFIIALRQGRKPDSNR